jgi:glycerophosphoryl diester phosphodiesterase
MPATESPMTETNPTNPPGPPPSFDVQGHRGARGLKPENTLPAFETALDLGVTTLELDLHYTADGHVVVWHDPQVETTKCEVVNSEFSLPQAISQLTLAQLQELSCHRNPDSNVYPDQDNRPTPLAGNDYRIVSLAQLFAFVDRYAQSPEKSEAQRNKASEVHFNIETKRDPRNPAAIDDDFDGTNPGAFEKAVLQLVEARGLVDRVIVQSFDHRSLWAVRRLNPNIRLAALTGRGRPDPRSYADQGATIWSPRASTLTPRLIETAHEAGLAVIPWTVNRPDDMRRLIDLGVDGLITDRPDLLLAMLVRE